MSLSRTFSLAFAGLALAAVSYAAKNPMLSDIPASVFGYAPTAGLALVGKNFAVTSLSLENPFINVALSLVIGAIFGYISEKVAGAIVKK